MDGSLSYLSFQLGNMFFALPVSRVHNIIEMSKIEKVPHSPIFLIGMLQMRSSRLPVVDMRIIMGQKASGFDENNCILILELKGTGDKSYLGVLVDSLYEVIDINESIIEKNSSNSGLFMMEFKKDRNTDIYLLNPDYLLKPEELEYIQNINNGREPHIKNII